MKNKAFSRVCLLSGILALSSCGEGVQGVSKGVSGKTVTDPDMLREITDRYRSDPSRPNDFIPQSDATVIDKRTGLQWMRCSLGQEWTGKTCSGEAKEYSLQDALNQHLEFAGYDDWRLPTIAEIETLIYCYSGHDEGRNMW